VHRRRANFAEDLQTLTDKAFPELKVEARELLVLQVYLHKLEHPFSVKQRWPKTLDEVAAATLEMES
jgi:hypothetical protein